MKKIISVVCAATFLISCSKIEETVNTTVETAKQKAQEKAREAIQETVNDQLSKIVNAENIRFDSIFPQQNAALVDHEIGKKVAFPNGQPFYVFKYKTTDKDALLKSLVEQPTVNEAQSLKEFQKVDGSLIIEKITFFEKFLPANTIDLSFLDDIKNDKNIEYYKVKRFPNSSTIIYNPKNQTVYQFVEVKK